MDFKKQKPIYLQIADTLCERIVAGEWQVDERVPSVRDVAAELGVNPNTVMRTYDYFVEPKAGERIRKMHRQEFLDDELPYFVQRMNMLGFTWEELINESKNIQR